MLTEKQFYCVVCRKKVSAKADDIGVKVYKNRIAKYGETPTLKAYCSSCDTNLTKFIKYKDQTRLTKKYGKY